MTVQLGPAVTHTRVEDSHQGAAVPFHLCRAIFPIHPPSSGAGPGRAAGKAHAVPAPGRAPCRRPIQPNPRPAHRSAPASRAASILTRPRPPPQRRSEEAQHRRSSAPRSATPAQAAPSGPRGAEPGSLRPRPPTPTPPRSPREVRPGRTVSSAPRRRSPAARPAPAPLPRPGPARPDPPGSRSPARPAAGPQHHRTVQPRPAHQLGHSKSERPPPPPAEFAFAAILHLPHSGGPGAAGSGRGGGRRPGVLRAERGGAEQRPQPGPRCFTATRGGAGRQSAQSRLQKARAVLSVPIEITRPLKSPLTHGLAGGGR